MAIEYTIDTKHLQQALDKLEKWEGKWNMAFHLSLKMNIQSNWPTPSMVLHNHVTHTKYWSCWTSVTIQIYGYYLFYYSIVILLFINSWKWRLQSPIIWTHSSIFFLFTSSFHFNQLCKIWIKWVNLRSTVEGVL